MDREERAKEIASLPNYGVLSLADYVESEIAKVQKKLDEARYISASVISEAERKAVDEAITYALERLVGRGGSDDADIRHDLAKATDKNIVHSSYKQNKGEGKNE